MYDPNTASWLWRYKPSRVAPERYNGAPAAATVEPQFGPHIASVTFRKAELKGRSLECNASGYAEPARGCARKNRTISRDASGPLLSVKEPLGSPPDHACPAPCSVHDSRCARPLEAAYTVRV